MKLQIQDGLPYVAVTIEHHGRQLQLSNVLLDTGSAGSSFSVDKLLTIGLQYEAEDRVHRIRGVGGAEFVFTKRIERLALDELQVQDFEIEIGAMDYGFDINGVIGMDFLTQVGAVIDVAHLQISKALP